MMSKRDRQLSRFFRTVDSAKKRTSGNLTKKPPKASFKKINKATFPKVSIVTYVYCTSTNRRWNLLKQCIHSISSQKYPNYEHIIVDDGSPINLGKYIKTLNDKHIRYLKKNHSGITKSTATFNHGLKKVTGKYCMILSSDDVHIQGCIRRLVSYLESHNNVVAVTGNNKHQTLNLNGKLISERNQIRNENITLKKALMKKNVVNACATMFRSSVLKKIILPPDATGFASDYDLWVKISEHGGFVRIKDVVIKYRNFGNATRIITQKDQRYRKKCIWHVKSTARARRSKK